MSIRLSDIATPEESAIERGIRDLCRIGNRFVGTSGERRAREYIAARMRAVGLENVREEPLQVAAYRFHEALCEVRGYGALGPCTGLQFSLSGVVEGEAVYLGRPTSEQDLDELETGGVKVRGRIVVFDSYYPYLLAESLAERGATGLVVVSEIEDGLVGNYSGLMYPQLAVRPAEVTVLPIPGVVLELTSARKLTALMTSRTVQLRVAHRAEYPLTTTANVVGEKPGTPGKQRVVLGAHYDTQMEGVGASDDASGVSALLATAEAWRFADLNRTVDFVAFSDEEHGFRGSTQFCRDHAAEMDTVVAMVNFDALGWAYPAGRALYADPSIADFARGVAGSLDWSIDEDIEASTFPGSDYNPFIDAGVPACFFWRFPPRHPYYHTAGDRIELLDFAATTDTARVGAAVAYLIAADPNLDFGRSRPSRRWLELRQSHREGVGK